MAITPFKNNKMPIKSYFEIKEDLKRKIKNKQNSYKDVKLTKEDRNLITEIKVMTKKLNLNNLTRTQAYLDFFIEHPDIHWALLGHMVSRNGGWNMTDLKGDLVNKFLSEKEQVDFFLFLERGNWLIFQDVFPQFLLYKKSLENKKNLFYLLPFLGVSLFMETMWNYYWVHGDCYLLAIATIINEQNYLEKRVIKNHHFKKTVIDTIGFKLYDFLRFNHIIFPFSKNENNEKPNIIGYTMKHFDSLHERILLGKKSYSLLFHEKTVYKGVLSWARNNQHTASRKDYWAHLFNNVNETPPSSGYRRRTKRCTLKKGANRIYSPPLQFAWKNISHQDAEDGDWCDSWRIIDYLIEEKYTGGEIYEEYCKTIEKIELAIIAKKSVLS